MSELPSPRKWCMDWVAAWNRFWFTPAAPHTLAAIRVLAGWMILYTHLVWALDLSSFLGPRSWIAPEVARLAATGSHAWSHLWYIHSVPWLWVAHIGALAVFLAFMVGWQTRVMSILTWILTVAYCHRLQGALFGLDQVNAMLAMYLMVGPSGAAYSVDAWLARRRGGTPPAERPSVGANIAIRLIQLHMCVIYLFGGLSKVRGETWWIGDAFWYAVANYEYQSLDMTWLVAYPALMSLISHVTIFWETYYCALVWPRLTRPIALGLAVAVHGGIAIFLGMPTFGCAMIIGNMAFVAPGTVAAAVQRMLSWSRSIGEVVSRNRGRAGEPRSAAT